MSLPPSGWYPDPYRTPGLLRWWDGSSWTAHTHQTETESTDVQATAVQAAAPATAVQPPALPAMAQPPTAAAETGDSRTQVLFLGDAWQDPPGPGSPGGPGGPGGSGSSGGLGALSYFGGPVGTGDRYGYLRARRRRRRWQLGGLAAGTMAAVGAIALIVANLSSSPPSSTAEHKPATPAPSTAKASPTLSAAAVASASASATTSAPGPLLFDKQSGLSYTQLPNPWQPDCPSAINNNGAFSWTAGESAIAGQVNGGQTTWYGTACSGPLPQQYGYAGVASLQTTTTNLENTFEGAYYNSLAHSVQPELSQPVTISGHPGWEVTFVVNYTNAAGQGASWTDEQGAVVVVDTGPGNAPAVFYASMPGNLGDSTTVAALVSSLQLTVVPNGGGSPADGGSPAPGGPGPGSPGAGDGNNP